MQVFSLTPSGTLEQVPPIPDLPRGCIVHLVGHGPTKGAVTSKKENGSYSCVTLSDTPEHGRFFVLDKYCKPYSKKFGIGRYWDDELTTIPEAELLAAIENAQRGDKFREDQKAAKEAAYQKEVEQLKAEYSFLQPYPKDKAARKANLLKLVGHVFPGLKFKASLSYASSSSSYDISWTAGPAENEFRAKINSLYSYRTFNGMSDCYDYHESAFCDLFGQLDIYTRRVLPAFLIRLANDDDAMYRAAMNVYRETSFPVDADITGFDGEQFTYALPEAKPAIEAGTSSGVTIEEYSDKSFVVRGDTRPLKDKLKAAGGLFSFRLKGGPGWIFSNNKREAVEKIL